MFLSQRNLFKKKRAVTTWMAAGLFFFTSSDLAAQEIVKSAPAGVGVYEMIINPRDGFIYTTGSGIRGQDGGAIYKIDPADLKLTDSILLRENPPFGLGFNALTQTAYTTNTTSGSVSAVSLKSGKLLTTIKGPEEKAHTREVIVDEGKNRAYVSIVGDPSSIWVIDGEKNELLYTIDNIGKSATGMAFSRNKDKIYVTLLGSDEIAVVDLASKKVVDQFPSGGEAPINIVTDGERLFVSNRKSNNVTVLSLKGELVQTIPVGEGPVGIEYDPTKDRVYTANRGSGTTSVIDAATYEVIASLPTGTHPNNIKVNSSTGDVFVLNKAKTGGRGDRTPPPADPDGDTLTKIR